MGSCCGGGGADVGVSLPLNWIWKKMYFVMKFHWSERKT